MMLSKPPVVPLLLVPHSVENLVPITTEDHNLAISNKWFMEFGRQHKDLIGHNHYDVLPDLPVEWQAIHQRGLAGEYLKNNDDLWIQENGQPYWLRWTVLLSTD